MWFDKTKLPQFQRSITKWQNVQSVWNFNMLLNNARGSMCRNPKSIECWIVKLQIVKVRELDVCGSLVLSNSVTYICVCLFVYFTDINPLYSVNKLQVTPSSVTLKCQLACKTSDLHCRIVSLKINTTEVPVTVTFQINQQQLILQELKHHTLYSFCVSAFINNMIIGIEVCGRFKTGELLV